MVFLTEDEDLIGERRWSKKSVPDL